MQLINLKIDNFRNFQSITIKLKDKNVIFGMNDVGKTNLMYALRFLLDREIRNYGFKSTDYFKNDVNEIIKITLEVSLEDYTTSLETQHIVSSVGGARNSQNLDKFYFELEGIYDTERAFGIPKISWGSDLNNLVEIPQRAGFSELDKIFKIIYVDPTIDLEKIFSKNKKGLFDQVKRTEKDQKIEKDLEKMSTQLNNKISSMNLITDFQRIITEEYKSLKDEKISIEMKSEMSIKGYFNDLIPYIKRENDNQLYPTSGDGRKKILAYSLLNYLIKKQEGNKIVIYLIEEPENSLHRSMQIALSQKLFTSKVYNYFFLSTHSAELLYEMDNASLVRIHSNIITACDSYVYHVDERYKNLKKKLNRSLATALFSNKVLLIEGPSERILFEKILSEVAPTYELDGGYILEVDGIDFEPYVKTLTSLNIKTIVKTDNDLQALNTKPKKYNLLGLNRCLKLINEKTADHIEIDFSTCKKIGGSIDKKEKAEVIKNTKLKIHSDNIVKIEKLKDENIYLSKIDLENDLFEVIAFRMEKIFPQGNAIEFLQKQKLINMIELVKHLTTRDCKLILKHPLFLAIKELID